VKSHLAVQAVLPIVSAHVHICEYVFFLRIHTFEVFKQLSNIMNVIIGGTGIYYLLKFVFWAGVFWWVYPIKPIGFYGYYMP